MRTIVMHFFLFHLYFSYIIADITSTNEERYVSNENKYLGGNGRIFEETEVPNDNDMAFLDIHDKLSDLSNFSDYISMSDFINNQKLTNNNVTDDFYLYEDTNTREIRDTTQYNTSRIVPKDGGNGNYSATNMAQNTYLDGTGKNETAIDEQFNSSNTTEYSTVSSENNSTAVKLLVTVKDSQIGTNKPKFDSKINSLKNPQTKTNKNGYTQSIYHFEEKIKSNDKPISNISSSNYVNVSMQNNGNDSVYEAVNSTMVKDETLESKSHPYNSTEQNSNIMPKESNSFGIWNVTLILAACIVVLSIVTGIGFLSTVAYRRYYWNKPQTFSDKCSNADSSGYIDDSTMKENSEEMYSLDNDSFLNSLEAMTIQNYWADNIKHTKL